jgi:chitodextrinase
MKARTYFTAVSILFLMASCQKEEQSSPDQSFAPPPSARCGCMAPIEFNAKNATDISIDLSWNNMPEAVAYRVEVSDKFSQADALGTIIFSEITEGTRVTVSRLAPNTKYQYRVTTLCGNTESSVSEIQTFVTADFHHGDPGPKTQKANFQKTTSIQ